MGGVEANDEIADAATWRAHRYQNTEGRLSLLPPLRAAFKNWIYLAGMRKLATTWYPGVLDQPVTMRSREGIRLETRIRDLGGPIDVLALGAYDFRIPWASCRYVIDVGAQVGSFSVWVARRSPTQIYAIEPNPQTYPFLVRNLELTGLVSRVRTSRVALAGRGGERPLYLPRFSEATSLLPRGGHDVIDVRTVTLRRLISDSKFPHVDLLKIDIEGAEWEVFDSIDNDDLASVSAVFVECHPSPGRSHLDLGRRLQGAGFEVAAEAFVHQAFVVAMRSRPV